MPSPNMGFVIPVVGVTSDHDAATDVSAALNTIDAHDHSPGGTKGAQLPLTAFLPIAGSSLVGNASGSSAAPTALTGAQAVALLPLATSANKGLLPATGTPSGKFLRDDLTFQTVSLAGYLQASNNLSDLVSASTARTNLGLATVAATGSAADLSGTLAAARLPAFSGDVSTSAGSSVTTIGANKVTNAMLAQAGGLTLKGNNSGSTANVSDLTAAQAKTLLAISTSDVSGLGTMATQAASAVAITGGSITGLSAPSSGSDAATKSYVDGLSQGVSWKASVVVATTTNGTLASAYANGQTIDGIVLATGNRILLKNQTTGSENGIYTVNASGAPTRALDSDTGAELVSAAVFVQQGTANADKAFVCTNDSITIGVTAIVFVAFASAVGALIASNNLSDLTSVSTARTNLGLAAVASSGSASDLTTGTLSNSRLSGVLLAANNLSDVTAATARTNLGLAAVAASGSAADLTTGTLSNSRLSGVVLTANNLSDVTAATAKTNLGLVAVASSGSIADIPDHFAAISPTAWSDPFSTSIAAATTTAGTLATSFANGQVIDGVTLATGNNILIKDQANAAENGIYVVAASGAPTRHASYNTGSAFVGLGVPTVISGTVNAAISFACVTPATITLGTTPIRFVKIPNAAFKNSAYASQLLVRGVLVATIDPSNGYTQWFQANRFPSGSAGAPSVAFSSDPSTDSGLFFTGTDNEVGWSSGGNEQLRVTAAGLKMTGGRVLYLDGGDVASAASITLPAGNSCRVTGSTTISNISGTSWTNGSWYRLRFAAACKIDGTGNVKFRSGSAFYSWGAGCTVDLEYDGSNWWVQNPVVMPIDHELLQLAAYRLSTAPASLHHRFHDLDLVYSVGSNLLNTSFDGILVNGIGSPTATQSSAAADVGGVIQLASSATANSASQAYFPCFVPGPGASKIGWMAARLKFATAVDSQAVLAVGYMNSAASAFSVGIGIRGSTSTTQIIYGYDCTSNFAGGTTGNLLAVDTAWHTVEIWWVGDGKVHFAIDGTESGTGYTPSSPDSGLGMFKTWSTNGTTAANRELDIDWQMSVCGRV